MQAPYEATLLRIFVSNDSPYEQIALEARAMKLAGTTVTRSLMGYGPAFEELPFPPSQVEENPIIVEIVDTDEKIKEFLPIVDRMIDSGLVYTQKVLVVRSGHKAKDSA
jgi:hypothetical protein